MNCCVHSLLKDLDILELQPNGGSGLDDDGDDDGDGDTESDDDEKADSPTSHAIHPRQICLEPPHLLMNTSPQKSSTPFVPSKHAAQEQPCILRQDSTRNRRRKLKHAGGARYGWKYRWPRHSTRLVDATLKEDTCCSKCKTIRRTSSSRYHQTRAFNILLRAGMQFLDQLSALDVEVSNVLLYVRDTMKARKGVCKMEDLLPPILRVVRALNQHKEQQWKTGRFPIEEYTQDLTRALKDASAESLLGIPVIVAGWVSSAEWGAFWRNQRKDYACLCDDGILYLFASEKQCSEYLFELARVRNGVDSELGKKNLKENAPQTQIDLTKDGGAGWGVRKGEVNSTNRQAFALFDASSKLRLILDVDTEAEADAWVSAISAELAQNERFANLKNSLGAVSTNRTEASTSVGGATSQGVRKSRQSTEESSLDTATPRQHAKLPLRWLHAQMERLNGGARQQRLKCANLSQALKDFRRDSIKINGFLYPGTCISHVFMALAMKILRCLSPDIHPDSFSLRGDSRKQTVSNSAVAAEMVALRLAKELLICSSRTNGGGDILDALHLVVPSDQFSVCPKSQTMEPIEVQLSSQPSSSIADTVLVPVAELTIKMTYSIIPNDSAVHDSAKKEGAHVARASDAYDSTTRCESADPRSCEQFEVVTTYYKKLVGDFHNWHELEGDVNLEYLR